MSNPGGDSGPYHGRRYYTRLSGRPHFSKDGEFLGYRGTSTEITWQIEAENEIRRARDELEQRVRERTRELSDEVEERKRMEADLRLAKEAAEYSDHTKSEFLANMSHELRTPLNSTIGFSDDEVTKEQRNRAKPVNFGSIYGMGAPGLAMTAWTSYRQVMSEPEADKALKTFFREFPTLK